MKESQNKQIKNYLLTGNDLTALQALGLFGCMRLSARIFELRQNGVPIGSRMQAVGNGKHVALYYLRYVPHEERK